MLEYGKNKTGDSVLVQGTGGVSVSFNQIVLALGATVIATSSNEKFDRVKVLGAKEVINYVEISNLEKEVLKLTNGEGVQQILRGCW